MPEKPLPGDTEEKSIQSLYIGTYTRTEGHVDGKSEGVVYLEIDLESGSLITQKPLAKVINPSFLVKDVAGKNLYAVSELAQDGEPYGYIHSFHIISPDSLNFIGKYSTNGRAPCHVQLDRSEAIVFVANYLDATITLYKREQNGELVESQVVKFEGSGINQARQEAPHLHTVQVSPDNSKVFVADLGSDKIWLFDLDVENAAISPGKQPFIEMVPGSGPRHIAIRSNDEFYVINELNSTVSLVQANEAGFSISQNISTLPPGYSGENSCADLKLHPSGNYLYGSNRGHDSIVAYSIAEDGKLKLIDHYPSGGRAPRNFNISPDGKQLIVANQNSDNLYIYTIDLDTGKLSLKSEIKDVMTPVCLIW